MHRGFQNCAVASSKRRTECPRGCPRWEVLRYNLSDDPERLQPSIYMKIVTNGYLFTRLSTYDRLIIFKNSNRAFNLAVRVRKGLVCTQDF